MRSFILTILAGCLILISCKKPEDAETLIPVDETGGYTTICKMPVKGFAQDVSHLNGLLYIAQGENGLMVCDASDPVHPIVVSEYTPSTQGYSYKVCLKDSVVYLAAGTFGVTVINAAKPEAPVVTVSNLSMKPARNLLVMGDYLFAAVSENGIKIASIEFPTQPDIRGGMPTIGYARGLATTINHEYLFAACGEGGLSAFNIQDFQNGYGTYPLTFWVDLPGYAEAVTIDDQRSLAFVACGTSGLRIVDFSDTLNVHETGFYDGGGYAKELVYKDQVIYMAAEKGGLQVIDVHNPANPVLLGRISLEYPLGIDFDGKYIYIADEVEGLVIVKKPGI